MKKKFNWLHVVSGVLSIVLGIYMLTNPAAGLVSLALVLACVFLINGISDVVGYFGSNGDKSAFRLVSGILTIILAIWLFSGTFWDIAMFVPYLVAFWVLFGGISKAIWGGANLKSDKSFGSALLLLGILAIIAGIVMMMHPIMTGFLVVYTAALILIYQGIVSFVMFFKLRKKQ